MLARHFHDATRLARDVRCGEIGARALLEHYLARVDAIDPDINAIVVQDRAAARARADEADAALARGECWGPLHGVPITVKEAFDVVGLPTTFGFAERAAHRASSDALAVQRLQRAGAILFGKTNVPMGLADFQSYNDLYGVTQNPWRHGHVPGGSSGGSAAALAAGLTGFEMGSDIGGSIRNPAHFCGVFGHKPTWELVPGRGHTLDGVLAMPDLAVVGPMARSAADLQLALALLAQPDEIEAGGLRVRLPRLSAPTSSLRIAVWADDPVCPVSSAVRARLQAVADALAAEGAHVDAAARPEFDAAQMYRSYDALLQAAMSGSVEDRAFDRAVQRAATLDAADRSQLARVTRAMTMRRREWAAHNEQRTRVRWAWKRFFEQWDFVLAPVMPVTAFAHDHGRLGERTMTVDGRAQSYFDATFWAGVATYAYLPSTVIPAGAAPDGLPVGVQIIGSAYGDARTIDLAMRLETLGFTFVPPPALAG